MWIYFIIVHIRISWSFLIWDKWHKMSVNWDSVPSKGSCLFLTILSRTVAPSSDHRNVDVYQIGNSCIAFGLSQKPLFSLTPLYPYLPTVKSNNVISLSHQVLTTSNSSQTTCWTIMYSDTIFSKSVDDTVWYWLRITNWCQFHQWESWNLPQYLITSLDL